MATITLYKDKVNGVGSLLDDIIKSSNNLNTQLGTLKNTLQGVDSSTCNLQDTVDSISSSSKSESDKVEDLKRLNGRLTEFIEMVSHRDSSAKFEIERAKEDFYTKYSYLKPECEKSTWEHICGGLKSACEWCKEHWKDICLVLEVIVAIVCLCIPGLQGVGMMILTGMLIGFLSGAIMGGLAGYAQYGVAGILPGVIDGAENGMLIGGLMGGLGGVGALAGATFGCSAAMTTIFSISTKITIGMMAFDLTTLAYNFQNRFLYDTGINLGLVDPNAGKFISDLNQKAHSNPFYNALQLVVGGAAAFSGGYVRTAACFVAGTVIATVDGFVQIENIKNGDIVLSTDVNTMRTRYMRVLDTYIREVDKLVHLTINDETLIATVDHPFYVNGHGFVRAEALCIGSQLMDVHGNICCVEHIFHEKLYEEKRTVYNFQVDDYHTYHVGYQRILVHNADYEFSDTNYTRQGNDERLTINDGEETVTYRRVQGGSGTNSSQQRIVVNDDGSLNISNKSADLNVSIDNGEHSAYFRDLRGESSYTVEFEVPKWFDDLIQENTVSQEGYRANPLNQGGTAPKLTDATTPGNSFELPAPWSEWIEEVASNGRIIK
ncbi:polymorphic toxin-type HINT domain-containing protein [uncultured Ruminococcus sp.]|uniref:polymorphic toxin-type HINT domain-containing protein n=1 Tax=uncultured Ruminococcus sp. TaxID=165186 RepID=UPI0025D928C8|nr:polymorphic toxin-type HINT domain-containing protein [uncultured Ruminococcus sp.]